MPTSIDSYSAPEIETFCTTQNFIADYFDRENLGSLITSIIIYSPSNVFGINKRIEELITEYSKLNDNWDNDDALSPTTNVIKKALYFSGLLEKHGQKIYHAAPGPNGEIMLDLRNDNKDRSLEIIFYPGKNVVVKFPEIGNPMQEEFRNEDLPELLEWLNQ